MIIRQPGESGGQELSVDSGSNVLRGLVLARDKTDFSVHESTMPAGTESLARQKNHHTFLTCLAGEGEVGPVDGGRSHPLGPGTWCLFYKDEEQQLRARTEMRLLWVLAPPLTGHEVPDEDGSFPVLAPRPALRKKNIFVMGLTEMNLEALRTIRNSENYEYVPLLSVSEVRETREYDIDGLLSQAREQLAQFPDYVDGLIHYTDFPVSTIAPIVCGEVGLPAAPLEAVLKCEHKFWSRVEQAASVPDHVPSFRAFDPFDDDALDKIGLAFPFWVKPIKSFSSYLGFRVDTKEDWNEAIDAIRANISRFAGSFDRVLEEATLPDEVADIGGGFCLAESIIGGRQCTQEGFVHKGEVVVYATIDSLRAPGISSFSRYQYPSRLPAAVRNRMTRITERFMRHIGFDNAPFNIEYFWDANEDRIWLLEVNPRISESHAHLFAMVDGASHHEIAVDLSLGHRPRLPHRAGEFGCAGKFFVRSFRDGTVRRVPSEADLEQLREAVPGTIVQVVPRVGQRLSELMDQDSYSYTLAQLWIGATNNTQLEKRHERALSYLPFEIAD